LPKAQKSYIIVSDSDLKTLKNIIYMKLSPYFSPRGSIENKLTINIFADKKQKILLKLLGLLIGFNIFLAIKSIVVSKLRKNTSPNSTIKKP
jgi:hypothetical protein